jgi:hypothetical protein
MDKKTHRLTIRKHSNKHSGEILRFYWENVHYISTPMINQLNTRNLNLVLKIYSITIIEIITIFFWTFFFIRQTKCGFKFDMKLYINI